LYFAVGKEAHFSQDSRIFGLKASGLFSLGRIHVTYPFLRLAFPAQGLTWYETPVWDGAFLFTEAGSSAFCLENL
jgi:hypothetical protein